MLPSLELVRDIRDGFRSRPGRAGLSVVAIGIGAAALSLLVAALVSLETRSRDLVAELGADAIVAVPEAGAGRNPRSGLRQRHAELIRASFPDLLVSTVSRSEARTLGSSRTLQVVATDRFLLRAREWDLLDGRFLDSRDVDSAERHAVVSDRLRADWDWKVGNVIMLGDLPFVVVGVVRTQGSALAGQFGDPRLVLGERLVFVPHTVPPLWSRDSGGSDHSLDALFMKAPGGSDPGAVRPGLQNLLSAPSDDPGPISWVTPEILVERIDRLKVVIGATTATVSLLCLVLGGTTLMSLLVTSIQERVSEIGLRRTLGATRGEVAALFVSESLALALLGALGGALLAHGLMAMMDPLLPIRLVTGWATWTVPVAVCALFGLLFSYGPATRAAKISPAAALRVE